MDRVFKIGTRGSPLALAQTAMVTEGLKKAHPDIALKTQVIATSGDRVQDRRLAEVGGKGLFVKEIEEALARRDIDLAVHSMKDVPGVLPPGFAVAALLPRADARDVLFARQKGGIEALARGACVGTSSPRRAALLLTRRPDLKIVLLRGNVGTRLEKFRKGEVEATLLAAAGLSRLGLGLPDGGEPLSFDDMLPAAGQGAVGIEIRADDVKARALLAALHDAATGRAVAAERAFLAGMDGDCHSPFAVFADERPGAGLRLRAVVARPDGSEFWRDEITRAVENEAAADDMGRDLALRMRKVVPGDYRQGRKSA